MIKLKRTYEKPNKDDGFRLLIDRLWPRGLSKEKAKIDLWLKDVAPSDVLRKWFAHDPKKWNAFKAKYKKELGGNKELLDKIRKIEKDKGVITFLYSAKDEDHNNAVILEEVLHRFKN